MGYQNKCDIKIVLINYRYETLQEQTVQINILLQ